MAEIVVGDVVAKLTANTTQFNQAIQSAIQQLAQLNQASAQTRTTQGQGQQSTNQLATAYIALAQSIAQQTQAYTHANQASLAYKQQQDLAREATRRLGEEQREAARKAKEAADAAKASGDAWRSALTIAGGIGIATSVQAIIGQMKDFAVSIVQTGARLEQLRASFNAISGDARTGAQQFQFVIDTSMKLGLELEGAARGFRSIAGATRGTVISAAETRDMFLSVSQATRVMGGSQQEFERALLAIGQIISKGTVQMEELRGQLGEAIPGSLGIAARAIGVTTERLNEMVASGETKAIPFVRAFTRQLREEFAVDAVKAADTTAAAFNRLATQLGLFKEFLFNSGIGAMLKTMAEEGAKALKVFTDLDAAQRLQGQEERAAARVGTGGLKERQVTPEQIQERQDLQRQLTRARQQLADLERAEATGGVAGTVGAAMIPPRAALEAFIEEKSAREQALIEEMRATSVLKDAEEQRTKAAKATAFQREQESNALTEIQDKLKTLQGIRDQQAKQQIIAPDYFGKTGGTSDQQITAAKELQKEYGKVIESLAGIVRGLPKESVERLFAGFPEVAKQVQDLNKEYAAAGKLQDNLKDKTRESTKATKDLAAEQKAAVTQAIQLDATLERLQGMTRRPTENAAEEAATRVRTQYAGAVAEAQKLIVELERSKTLQADRPEALAQARAVRDALIETGEAQAKLASDEVLKRQIAPLEEIALRYGLVTTEITSQSDHVQELASKYGLATKEAIDLAKAEELAASFTGTARQEAAEKYLDTIRKTIEARQAIEAKVPQLEQEALASAGPGMAAVRGAGYTGDLERQLEQLQVPREERLSARLRGQARRRGVELDANQEALLRQIEAQQRFNTLMGMAERVGDQAAQTITSGLLRIVDGTIAVGQGFQEMAKQILDSISQILLNEGFKLLIRFGLGALTGALTGSPAIEGSGNAPLISLPYPAQGGAIVNKPTTILAGENPMMNPEYVLNRPQMQSLMRGAMQAGPSAGGQAAGNGIAVILVDNRGQAEREAAQQRGMGRQVIIQEVIKDLSMGSGSSIGRMIRAGGH